MAMITFTPDEIDVDPRDPIETALFLGVRGDPSLESTQLRWQVRSGPNEKVQLESGATDLKTLGGALFLTTREPQAATAPGETPGPLGWMRWIAEEGRRSFQIQLAISGAGFARVCHLAEKGTYPDALLTFKDDAIVDFGQSADGSQKLWKNVQSKLALISEFTLRYDFSRRATTCDEANRW